MTGSADSPAHPSPDLMPWIADERHRAADLLDGLTPSQLASPSLCSAWTVHDVGAHLLMPLVTPLPRVVASLARSRFRFDEANLRMTARVARRTPAQISTGLRERAGTRFRPPGMGFEAPLNDLLVHQQDIRRPLGLPAALAPDRLRICLAFTAGRRLDAARADPRWQGLRITASDLEWSTGNDTGNDAAISGPGEALLMALNGRRAALADLTGPGAALLAQRWPA